MITDTSEKGLEGLVVAAMTGLREAPAREGSVSKPPVPYGGTGWLYGHAEDFDREHCVDLFQLRAFLQATQPKVAQALDLGQDGPTRRQFLARLQGEITKRGTIDVLRHGVKHGPLHLDLFYGTPSPGNAVAAERYARNADRVHKLITEDIPARVAADTAFQNAKKNSDKQNARIEHDKALARVMTAVLKDDTELFKQFMDNESFKRWLTDTVFGLTYEPPAAVD